MLKTSEELKEQAKKIGLKKWKVHECSMCGYPCGYIIESERISYDPGCYCSGGYVEERTWQDLADQYNRNQPERNKQINQSYLDETESVWKFGEEALQDNK